MAITGRLLKTDHRGWRYIHLDGPTTQELFAHTRAFWITRGQEEISDGQKAQILQQQSAAYLVPDRKPFCDLFSSFLNGLPGDRPVRLVEFGCSNGTLLDHITARHPAVLGRLRFLGFEALPLLVEDGRCRYPTQSFVQGTEQALIEAPASLFADAPYDAFVAVVSLCMIGPEATRKILARVRELTGTIVLWDMLANLEGPDLGDQSIAVTIPGLVNVIFAHPWRQFLDEAGFRIESIAANPLDVHSGIGFGALIARHVE